MMNDASKLESAIEASRWILALEEDWDDAGAMPYEESTWNIAVQFVRDVHAGSSWVLQMTDRMEISPPRILPGPEGSIDLIWDTPERSVLANVPTDGNVTVAVLNNEVKP